jgi:hypothetical protein
MIVVRDFLMVDVQAVAPACLVSVDKNTSALAAGNLGYGDF